MNLDDHKTRKNRKFGQNRFVNINYPESAADKYWRFEEFASDNKINRSSFVRALIKEFLDKRSRLTIRQEDE